MINWKLHTTNKNNEYHRSKVFLRNKESVGHIYPI
jgi:hypothetical protein